MPAIARIVFGSSVVALVLALPLWLQAQQTRPAFEVASIRREQEARLRPGEGASPWARKGGLFSVTKVTVAALVVYAYDLKPYQLAGGPDWIRNDRFTINARADGDVPERQIRLMVQSLLAERFKLVSHVEEREMPFRALVLDRADGRLGPYMRSLGDACDAEAMRAARAQFPPRVTDPDGGMMTGGCVGLDQLATMLSVLSDMPVLDRTGLTGKFAYDMRHAGPADPRSGDFRDALEEQLGLTLKTDREPITVRVIDAIASPSEN